MKPTQPHPFAPAADPVDRLRECERIIRAAGWWGLMPTEEHWPLTTRQAALMLAAAGEFDIDPDRLEDLVNRRLIAPPARGEEGCYEWSAEDVVRAANQLEARQQWRPTPSKHDPKKNGCRLALELARESGELVSVVEDERVPRFDLRHLLTLLVRLDSHEGRVKTATLLEAVLQHDHGIIV